MVHQRDKWVTAAAAAFISAALSACNLGDDRSAEPKVVELPVPIAATGTAQAQPLEVKRYGAQEQLLTDSVRVTGESARAYFEADNKGESSQVLAKSTLVKRKASFGEYSLVEYPTPKGDTDLGWVLTKDLAGVPEGAVDTSAKKKAVAIAEAKTADAKTATDDSKKTTTGTKEKTDSEAKTAETKTTDKTTAKTTETKTGSKATGETATKSKSTKSSKLGDKATTTTKK